MELQLLDINNLRESTNLFMNVGFVQAYTLELDGHEEIFGEAQCSIVLNSTKVSNNYIKKSELAPPFQANHACMVGRGRFSLIQL